MQRPRNPNFPRHSLRLTLLYTLDVDLQPPNYTGIVPETEASVSARLIPQTGKNSLGGLFQTSGTSNHLYGNWQEVALFELYK
jgi:hypothetical protein